MSCRRWPYEDADHHVFSWCWCLLSSATEGSCDLDFISQAGIPVDQSDMFQSPDPDLHPTHIHLTSRHQLRSGLQKGEQQKEGKARVQDALYSLSAPPAHQGSPNAGISRAAQKKRGWNASLYIPSSPWKHNQMRDMAVAWEDRPLLACHEVSFNSRAHKSLKRA